MNIEFICPEENIIKYFPVLPTKKFMPDWYKEMPLNNQGWPTMKNCMPVLDYMTSGYVIQNTFEIKYSIENNNITTESNNHSYTEGHPFRQFPIEFNGKKTNYVKINQPWVIKTPPGYSCLIFQPDYFFEDRIKFFPGIVDTDTYDRSISIVGYLLKDQVVLEPGDPLVCVLPFKRESWESTITHGDPGKDSKFIFYLEKAYQRFFNKKKNFN